MRHRHDLSVQPPVVEHRAHEYVLTWTQGDNPFFFEPTYQVMDGRLIFTWWRRPVRETLPDATGT